MTSTSFTPNLKQRFGLMYLYLSETFRVEYETGDESVCQKLRSVLVGIQTGSIEDTKGWVTCIN